MRVGLIAPPWAPVPPSGYGGIESMLDRWGVGLRRAGHDVLLFATGDSTARVRTESAIDEAEGERIGADVPELLHVMAAYDAMASCEVIHDHTMVGPAWGAATVTQPIVTTVHGPFDDETRPI